MANHTNNTYISQTIPNMVDTFRQYLTLRYHMRLSCLLCINMNIFFIFIYLICRLWTLN